MAYNTQMARRVLIALALFAVSACGDATSNGEVTSDYVDIVQEALSVQPDLAKERRQFIAEYPNEASVFEGFFDHRLCVSRQTAGDNNDFERVDWKPNSSTPPPGADLYGKRWDQASSRKDIPKAVLPSHLRWDTLVSFCPNGVLRLGNPVIEGSEARIYIESKCSGLCSWGDEIIFKRVGGKWIVDRQVNRWQS